MRKVSLILAVLLFAITIPAGAAVTITCNQVGDTNEVLVSYANAEPNKVRAFALDVTVSAGVITGVDDSISPSYTIYPGSIDIVDGEVNDPGTAVADPCDYPADTQPGIGTSGITVEMGALYSPPEDNSPNAPGDANNLFSFFVSETCTVTITENGARGGVVLSDPNADPTVVAPGCEVVLGCYPECLPDHQEWLDVGEPNCWCYERQCHGDADNTKEYIAKKGWYYVHFGDLGVLLTGWNIKSSNPDGGLKWPDPNICADFAHDSEYIAKKGYFRIHFNDLGILLNNWSMREPPDDVGIPPDCLDCPD